MSIKVKILGYRSPQRYPVWRTIQSAFQMIQQNYPDVDIDVLEVRDLIRRNGLVLTSENKL